MQKNPVFFLHGFTLEASLWRPVINALPSSYRALALDLPGHGKSPANMPTDLSTAASLTYASIVNAIGKGQAFHLVGHSLGGYIALELAHQKPDLIISLCLINTESRPDNAPEKERRDFFIADVESNGTEGFKAAILPKLFSDLNVTPELAQVVETSMSNTQPETIINGLKAMRDRLDHSATIKGACYPCLIVRGLEDQMYSEDDYLRDLTYSPNKQHCQIPQAGHLLPLEQPEFFARVYRNFLETSLRKAN